MAIIKRGIIGAFSGKIGNIVGTSWKGIGIMKSLPLSVANPKTVGQVAQRTAFKACTLAGSALLSDVCKPLWDREAQRMSGFNAFVRNNIKAFSALGKLDVASFKPTLGVEDAVQPVVSQMAEDDVVVTVTWSKIGLVGKQALTDEMQLIAYNETQKNFGSISGATLRDDATASIPMPTELVANDDIHVWLCARDASHTSFFAAGSELSSTVQ